MSNAQTASLLNPEDTIDHPRHQQLRTNVEELLAGHVPGRPFVLPVIGPTQVGKSQLLYDLRDAVGRMVRGPGTLIEGSSFRLAKIPVTPNDRDIYCSIIEACGCGTWQRERTPQLRGRALRLLRDNAIQVVAIDETNHLAERGANLANRAAGDHLKALADQSQVALIIAGIPRLQKIIDQNEQLRDRCRATITYLPYDWNLPQDRNDFATTVFSILGLIEGSGVEVELDRDDCVHRLYAASGGRIGIVLRLMDGARHKLQGPLTFEAIGRAASRYLQDKSAAQLCFGPEPLDEAALVRAFIKVLQEADLPYTPRSTLDLEVMAA